MYVRSVSVLAVVVALFAVMSCTGRGGGGDAAPFFGFGSLIGSTATNGTSALGLLALSHLQHKIDALTQVAELFSLAGNATTSFFVK